MKIKYLIPISTTFGVLIMITDELMVRFAEGHKDYDLPVLGSTNIWVVWQVVFAFLLITFSIAAFINVEEIRKWQTK